MQYIPARDNSFTWFSVGFIIGLLIAKLTCSDAPTTPPDTEANSKIRNFPKKAAS